MAATANFKKINETFIFSQYKDEYEKSIFEFIKHGSEIDTKSKEFEDIRYDIKKMQVKPFLLDVIEYDAVKLYISNKPMDRSTRVITAKDIKGGTDKYKVYVDCSHIIEKKDGIYKCANTKALISHIVEAMVNLVYFSGYANITAKSDIVRPGAYAFASLFNNIINYLFKTNSVHDIHNRCMYLASQYFLTNIIGSNNPNYVYKHNTDISKQVARISTREAELIDMYVESDSYKNIDTFIQTLKESTKLSKLTTEAVISAWVKMYTPSTLFALEYFPAFSGMLTNAYFGAYLNNQSTIEKVTNRGLPEFVKAVLALETPIYVTR